MELITSYTKSQKDTFIKMVSEQWGENYGEIEQKFYPKLYLGIVDQKTITGAALFTKALPESNEIIETAKNHNLHNKPYLGYFVVDNALRGKGVGSEFLNRLQKIISPLIFWLVIEDLKLQQFYEKNGLKLIETIGTEKILSLK